MYLEILGLRKRSQSENGLGAKVLSIMKRKDASVVKLMEVFTDCEENFKFKLGSVSFHIGLPSLKQTPFATVNVL